MSRDDLSLCGPLPGVDGLDVGARFGGRAFESGLERPFRSAGAGATA